MTVKDRGDIVVRFYPISSRKIENIQDDFFDELSSTLSRYYLGFSKAITRYIRSLKLLEGEGLLNNILNSFESLKAQDEKSKINTAIRKIGKNIFVIVEDLDRLSGAEFLEVLKLIDRNGDFCNVFYLSAYDKKYVNGVLQKELGHDVSQDFTDKYFCYELPLPVQKKWVIKNYIGTYLQNHTIKEAIDPNYRAELVKEWGKVGDLVVDILDTTRHVKRL